LLERYRQLYAYSDRGNYTNLNNLPIPAYQEPIPNVASTYLSDRIRSATRTQFHPTHTLPDFQRRRFRNACFHHHAMHASPLQHGPWLLLGQRPCGICAVLLVRQHQGLVSLGHQDAGDVLLGTWSRRSGREMVKMGGYKGLRTMLS